MCTAYQFSPLKHGRLSLVAMRQAGLDPTPALIRPTNAAQVVLPDGEVATMRWGFARPWSRAIVNSRDDKLAGPVWREAFAARRCLIPIAAYYEWSGPTGDKRTHRFTPADADLLWAAGLWEESAEWGRCYSMITCSPNALVEPVHDRMPAVLEPQLREAYLCGRLDSFAPSPHLLQLESDAPNPLRKPKSKPAGSAEQGELF